VFSFLTAKRDRILQFMYTEQFQHNISYLWTIWLAVWFSGNALASINVVALYQTQLVLRWVTVCGRVNHFGM